MKREFLLFLLIVLIPSTLAIDRVYIEANTLSYSEFPRDEIYVGSMIYYNISLFNPNDYEVVRDYNISIIDENGEKRYNIIENSISLQPEETKQILSYKEGERIFEYISPLKSGSYLLKVSVIGDQIEFLNNITKKIQISDNESGEISFYRYNQNYMEFPFAVASLYEKRLKEISQKRFEESQKQFEDKKELTKKMFDLNVEIRVLTDKMTHYTKIILIASIIMLIVAIIQLLIQILK